MSKPTSGLTFRFLDPVQCLIRLITQGPLSGNPDNLALYPEQNTYYGDFAHKEKMHRIYKALPGGTAALTAILFFDSINRDAKGFSKGDGVILVAKVSLGSFPPIHIAKTNTKLKVAEDFTKAARRFFYARIYETFANFNATNGAKCELQNGERVHFSKAIILAIYTDQPAATKCSVTGSACPQCYTARHIMGTPARVRGSALTLRTPLGMEARRNALRLRTGTIYVTRACSPRK